MRAKNLRSRRRRRRGGGENPRDDSQGFHYSYSRHDHHNHQRGVAEREGGGFIVVAGFGGFLLFHVTVD